VRKQARVGIAFCLPVLAAVLLLAAPNPGTGDWTHFVRIGAYSLKSDNAAQIVRNATEDHVFGIEIDNDIPGRYESFLNPREKLAAIRELAQRAHAAHNYAFVYIAGLECITAHADQTPHTLAKDHPDWLQRKLSGEPAIFKGGDAFWIAPGDEDVWISPYAPEWRKTYMQRVRQIAATGIDGIYVDIPYWMTHFEGWEDSWASFDDYTVAAFRKATGLDARHALKLGDFSDPNFRQWVDFRMKTITDFMREIDQNAKAVNPHIKTIPEIYPGIDEAAVRVGADVYQLYPVVDAVAHEYEFGGGDHMASSRTPLDWLKYQVGMRAFRAFAQGKPTWILNYSWDGDKKIKPSDAMQNLAMSQVAAGANFWDAPGHVMAGSNDRAMRQRIFAWIATNQKELYNPREPMQPDGIYFSPRTRDYFESQFLPEFEGWAILLTQDHREWQVVTPRTLSQFQGKTLILPGVRMLDDAERASLKDLLAGGTKLIITGEDTTGLPPSDQIVRLPQRPGADYLQSLDPSLEKAGPQQAAKMLAAVPFDGSIQITASPLLVTHIARVNGVPHIFMVNFSGLRGGQNAVPAPESEITVTVPAAAPMRMYYVAFLGEKQEIQGKRESGRIIFHVPAVNRGGILWLAPAPSRPQP
jgi:glycosyl hydrolase family 10